MSFDFEMPEDLGPESNFLSQPGTYHCLITEVKENQGPKGNPIDGFTLGLDILGGTVEGQEHKVFNLTLFNANLTGTEKGQKMSRQKQAALLIAANLVDPTRLGQRVSINLQSAAQQQIVCHLVKDERSEEGYLQLNYADLWHVDDPRANGIQKNERALAMIPKDRRHDAAWFESLKKAGQKSNPQQQQKPATAAAGVNFDDL